MAANPEKLTEGLPEKDRGKRVEALSVVHLCLCDSCGDELDLRHRGAYFEPGFEEIATSILTSQGVLEDPE